MAPLAIDYQASNACKENNSKVNGESGVSVAEENKEQPEGSKPEELKDEKKDAKEESKKKDDKKADPKKKTKEEGPKGGNIDIYKQSMGGQTVRGGEETHYGFEGPGYDFVFYAIGKTYLENPHDVEIH